MTVSIKDVVATAEELGLAGRPVMVHSSLRSLGEPVERGADGVLDALHSLGCTVLVPTFSEAQYGAVPPSTMRPDRNAIDYADFPAEPAGQQVPEYTVGSRVLNATLGVLPARLLDRDGARRGNHPLNSFAAVGPLTDDLIGAQDPADVYGPIRRLADHDGAVLMIGLGLNRMTALHLAEEQAGRRLLVRWAGDAEGRVFMVETGSCSDGFPRLAPLVDPLARSARLGASRLDAFPARAVLATAAAAIAADPELTRCPNTACLRCRDTIPGGPIGPAPLG